tara:strand:+ start:170 stop:805 length:636 start_codon:yes stop_codon:yes gene_type:complete
LKKTIITIDGPAASGKGKIAKYISKKWKFKHLDSGVLYRRLAYVLIKEQVNINSKNDMKDAIFKQKTISFRNYKKFRNENISKIASKIAVYNFVRDYINKIQRNFVNLNQKNKRFVIDGRDIGSIVFKNADLKLYIDVTEENRAKRRYKQLIDSGEKSIYPQILKDIKLRDKKDKNRKNSPLVIPKDAIIIKNNESFKKTREVIDNIVGKL